MAMIEHEPVTSFEQWYVGYNPEGRNGMLDFRGLAPCADKMNRMFTDAKREMDARVHNYDKLEMLADGQVISPKPDLPNVSSGETEGLIGRMARNLVQHTPNIEVVTCFDDDKPKGIFARHVLTQQIIGDDRYSNDMQQNLFASTKTSLTLGFACVIPVLLQDAKNGWYMKYDTIHYRDVFPEPGCKDVRNATCVFVRRYLTQGEVFHLIKDSAIGWDTAALKLLIQNRPPSREQQSVPHQTKKHHQIPEGYEIITCYTNDGRPFLTWSANTKMLLRIELNKHPLREHPVHFLVLEKDDMQPLGKSQVEKLLGRQEFQDLMLNGAMKLWYRNINPSILGFGAMNALPNLSPGKYTAISNPNAKIEAFEINTQTLMQYGTISEQNLGSMVNLLGSADQQMAQNAGNGMSATPQGVEAQQQMVDITTNNYQKAIESFFSHYCSYALTIFFQELRAVKKVHLTADALTKLVEAGFPVDDVNEDYTVDMDFAELAKEYWVRCVPGSLVEMEDEKQLRVLGQLFVPLSQAMPALAATQNPEMINQAAVAMQYIIGKQIELSGAASAKDIGLMWKGETEQVAFNDQQMAYLEEEYGGATVEAHAELETLSGAVATLQEQMAMVTENMQLLLDKLGVTSNTSSNGSPTSQEVQPGAPPPAIEAPTVYPESA